MTPGSRSYAHSYLFLRKAIGVIGVALPVVLIVGGLLWQGDVLASISGYYYSHFRNVFVGSMCAIGVFLISYRGTTFWEDILSTVAGLAAIGVGLAPTTPDGGSTGAVRVIGYLHIGFATTFFVTLAAICIFWFPSPDPGTEADPARDRWRGLVYRSCGGAILGAIALILVLSQIPATEVVHPMLLLETVSIFAFSAAWFLKGIPVVAPVEAAAPATLAARPSRG